MSSILDFLTSEEWDEINANLPDIIPVITRINRFPTAEWLVIDALKDPTFQQPGCLRLARVCLHDAGDDVQGARFALGQAIGVRKFYLEQRDTSKSELESIALGDFYGRFYADDVPLRLYSATKDALDAVYYLYGLEPKKDAGTALKRLLGDYKDLIPTVLFTKLTEFEKSAERNKVWDYRNRWVHNQAPRIEGRLYNPPRIAGTRQIGLMHTALLGMKVKPQYTKSEWVEILTKALSDMLTLYDACLDAWEEKFNVYRKE